jgi:hypothetical protein
MYILVNHDLWSDYKCEFLEIEKPNWNDNWFNRYFPNRKEKDHTQAFSIDGEMNGIKWNEELASSDGISVMLFIPKNKTMKDVQEVQDKLNYERDVVCFYYRFEGGKENHKAVE